MDKYQQKPTPGADKEKTKAQVAEKSGMKPDIKPISLLICAINPFICLFILKNAPQYISYVLPYLNAGFEINSLEGKLNLALLFGVYFSALYLLFISITIIFRGIFIRGNPVYGQDPPILVVCQRVLTNHLEQLVIFAPNWLYYLFVSAKPSDKNLLITWAAIFLFSRVAFGIGYIIGSQIRVSLLRQTGFLTGLFLNVFLLLQNTGLYDCLSFIS